jgi:hypothetical protein
MQKICSLLKLLCSRYAVTDNSTLRSVAVRSAATRYAQVREAHVPADQVPAARECAPHVHVPQVPAPLVPETKGKVVKKRRRTEFEKRLDRYVQQAALWSWT